MKKHALIIIIASVFLVGCVTTSKVKLRPGMVPKKYNVIAVATDSNDGFHMSEAKKFTSSFSSIGTLICNSTLLLDSDATKENIQETLNSTSKPDIVNVIYLSGHGDEGRIIIEKPLIYKNLISMCRNTEALEIIIVGACYSGSIRKQLSEDDNIIVISSTDGDFSDSASEQVGITASLYDVFKHPQKADLNGDLQVTMEEVWLRAKEVHEEFLNSNTWKEQSQYWNSVPENKYGLFGNKDFILFEI